MFFCVYFCFLFYRISICQPEKHMKITHLLAFTILSLSIASFAHAQTSFGQSEKINNNWEFSLDGTTWSDINLPHDWSIKLPLSPSNASSMGYLPGGTGFYKKIIHIPLAQKDKKVYVYFEGIYNRSEVYLNGNLLGKRPNGYVSFMYDATPYIEYGKENTILVRVDHSKDADSRWYTGSGIYRNVWLIYSGQIHIAQWGVYAYPETATKKQGILAVQVEIKNETKNDAILTIKNELIDNDGKIVSENSEKVTSKAKQTHVFSNNLKINNPQLWDVDNPNLYQLKTTLLDNGRIIDQSVVKTGFRTFSFHPDNGFFLNGKPTTIKGVCVHHDGGGVLGSAVPRDIWETRLKTLKTLGCNAVRTSHNPLSFDFYDLCDELGLLVMDEAFDEWEFSKRKWLDGWNVGVPGYEGSADFFDEWAEKDISDMVRRDRNHISIFAWSIGNEVDYPNDPYSHPVLDGKNIDGFVQPIFGGYKKDAPHADRLGDIAKKLVDAVKKQDKTRPVTAGLAGVIMSNETKYPDALDIAGYNYSESLYAEDHKRFPKRVIYGSENQHDYQSWKAVKDNEFISGQFLWTGIDYLGEAGKWPSRGFYTGLLDLSGFVKPRGFFRKSLWTDSPMIYIGTYPLYGKSNQPKDVWSSFVGDDDDEKLSFDAWPVWNYENSQMIRVVCYTNAVKARLELNGKTIGEIKNQDENTGIIHWDIPFQPGKLEAIALDENNRESARYSIQSSACPFAISVSPEDFSIDKNKEILQIEIRIIDEYGVPVVLADNEITCEISGPAQFLGFESGNNHDMSDYTDNIHRAYFGRLSAYVKPNGTSGTIHLRFTSPLLKPVEMNITVK